LAVLGANTIHFLNQRPNERAKLFKR